MNNNGHLKIKSLIFFVLCWVGFQSDSRSSEHQFSTTQIIKWLKELKPLPKVHYSWPVTHSINLGEKNPLLLEYVRLTHAISLRGEGIEKKPENISNSVKICNRINASNPDIPCSIAIHYSPWHRSFDKDLPPTDFGKSHSKEVGQFRDALLFIKSQLGKENKRLKSDIKLTAIILDSERFHIGNHGRTKWNISYQRNEGVIFDVAKWDSAITEKHTIIYTIAKEVFPDTRVEQYERGGWMPSASKSGWMQAQWYTLDEPGDTFSLSLYRIPELADTRDAFRRTLENAKKHGVNEVTPYVALGAGFRRQVDSFNKWGPWDYDLIYSWQIGAEINAKWFGDRPERFAPWHAAKTVIFFPDPFAKRYPAWWKHFVAYVRGANVIRELPEVE